VAISPDGASALTADYDNTVRLWDVKNGREVQHFTGHKAQVTTVTFSPDGRRVFSGSADGTVRGWDVATGQEVVQFGKHGLRILDNGVSVSPDGRRVLSGGGDKRVWLWDANTGAVRLSFTRGIGWAHGNPFAADGRHAVFPGSTLSAPQIVDVDQDPLQPVTLPHEARVNAVAFAPDGETVATASEDGKIILWNLAGKRLWERQLPGWVACLAFSSDGRHLASANANGTAYILRLP
jgi:WD40 repeat protein